MNENPKKQMNDVIVPQNNIIRQPVQAVRVSPIPEPHMIPSRREETGRIEQNPFFEKGWKKKIEPLPKNPKISKNRSNALPWAFLLIVVLIGGFLLANYFSSATIEITPTTQTAHIDRDFTVIKDAQVGDLTFEFMSLTDEETREVPATIEKKIQKKASGKVTIFNAYNGVSQRLIKNTRLESSDHKIFRIDESVVVPGATIVGNKVTVPGAVDALVYADVPGKEYNIGLSDFTIPGFKGDPRYEKFTAKSKSDAPLSGGFSGSVKVPADEVVVATQEEIKQNLKKTAVEKARAQIPDNVSFFPGSVVIKFEEVPENFTSTDTAKVSMRATVSVFFFNTAVLTKKLAEALPSDSQEKSFEISKMSSLIFSFIDPVDNVVLSDLSKIRFHVAGDATFVGKIDSQKIRTAFAGKNKKDFSSIIEAQNNIGNADAVIRPMWQSMFPIDPEKIAVKILNTSEY